MREKLNSNPTVQMALIGILLVGAGFLLITQLGGGGGSSSDAATTTPAATTPATTDPATGATASTAATIDPATGAPTTASPVTDIPAAEASAIPTPPLPAPVLRDYKSGKTVVLLVVRGGGIDDRFVGQSVHGLAPLSGVDVFVIRAKRIARYAAITLGVDVERVPALIVLRPRRLSGGTPQATVTYGYQSPQSIVQAVLDASYDGPASTYHPN